MKHLIAYLPIPCSERLPKEPFSGIGIMNEKYSKSQLSKTNLCLLGNYYLSEKPKDQYTHWLEKKEGYFLTKEELKDFAEKVRRYFIDNTKHVPQAGNAVYVMGSTDDFFEDWLNTQNLQS